MNKKLIHSLFEKTCSEFPLKSCVTTETDSIAYQELNIFSNRLSHWLINSSLSGHTAIVWMTPGIELVVSLLATSKSGVIYLPISPQFADHTLRSILNEHGDVILTTIPHLDTIWDFLASNRCKTKYVVVLDKSEILEIWNFQNKKWTKLPFLYTEYPDINPSIEIDTDAGNYIFYTSGSTGLPKGILGCYKSLSHFIHWEIEEFNIGSDHRVSQLTSHTFDASLRDILVPLCTGSELFIPGPQTTGNSRKLIEWIDRNKITLIHCVPSVMRLLIKELENQSTNKCFPQLRFLLLAGEPLFTKNVRQWRNLVGEHVQVVNLWGTTETTMCKSFYRVNELPENDQQILPVGKPISKTSLAVINEGMSCRIGEIGEVYIKTPFWTKGYLNENENSKAFVQNPLIKDKTDIVYRTGDLGKFSPDGNLQIIGRKDEQVKINGIRIELGAIREAVLAVKDVEEVFITVYQDASYQSDIVCYFISKSVSEEMLRTTLSSVLNSYMIPAYFVRMETFPLNLNGKIDRKSLPDPESLKLETEYEAPCTPIEESIADFWKSILNVEKVSRDSSFFKLGGTSLKVVQLIARLYERYGVLLTIAHVFKHSTIKAIAGLVEANRNSAAIEKIERAPSQDHYAISPLQESIWIAQQYERNSSAFNMQSAFHIRGLLDLDRLSAVFTKLLERHESLRTSFINLNGDIRQEITDATDIRFAINFFDFCEFENCFAAIKECIEADIKKSFDLTQPPLLRVSVFKAEERDHILILTLHHIISDGWSMKVIMDEAVEIYNAMSLGTPTKLEPLVLQYKDCVEWQRSKTHQVEANSQRYWIQTLQGAATPINLPTDYQNTNGRNLMEGRREGIPIEKELLASIENYCRTKELTPFMLLLGVVNILLYHLSGQTDIVVGSPYAGRYRKEFESQVGLFVNLLPLRSQVNQSQQFSAFLKQIRANTLSAYEQAHYPFVKIVESIEKLQGKTMVFNVLVQSQDMRSNGAVEKLHGADITPFDAEILSSKYDLTFTLNEGDDCAAFWIEYKSYLFSKTSIDSMLHNVLAILDVFFKNPEITVHEIRQQVFALQVDKEAPFASRVISEEF